MSVTARLLLVALLVATCGCTKTKETLTLYLDGAGKVEVTTTTTSLFGAKADATAPDARKLHEELAQWSGVAAWSDLRTKVRPSGEIERSATGWFKDVNRVGRAGDRKESFAWSKGVDGKASFRWTRLVAIDADKDKKLPLPRRDGGGLDVSPEKLDALLTLIDDFDVREVVLPGTITDASGCKTWSGRTATATLFSPELHDVLKRAPRDLTEEQLRDRLSQVVRELGTMRVGLRVGDVAAEERAFRDAFAAAKKAWESSHDRKAVEDARVAASRAKGWY